MHCKNPACKDACPVNAIVKTEEGAVVIKTETCIGCKFCVTACPFGIPQYNAQIEKVSKCHMCFDRIPEKEPSCVQACPTDALVFDERSKIITMATERKAQLSPGYIYGDVDNKPLGGTSFIYVSDVNVETLGVPKVGESDISAIITPNAKLLLIPAVAGGLLYLAAWRKKRMEE
jgi:Fe-S-cluster-containing dehydrogenase component